MSNSTVLLFTLLIFESFLFHSVFLVLWEECECACVGEVEKKLNECKVWLCSYAFTSIFLLFCPFSFCFSIESIDDQWMLPISMFFGQWKKMRFFRSMMPFLPPSVFALVWTNVYVLCCVRLQLISRLHLSNRTGRTRTRTEKKEERKKKKKPCLCLHICYKAEKKSKRTGEK